MKIGITGAEGFIGSHLRYLLNGCPDSIAIGMGKKDFNSDGLENLVSSVDSIVHLAGMCRGNNEEILETNIILTKQLINACKKMRVKPHIIFASSTHIDRDTAYGKSKIECAKLLNEFSQSSCGLFTNFIFPNIFGEFGKPFYNSVVSTFCHQIANSEEPTINDSLTEQIHVQDVVKTMYDAISKSQTGEYRIKGTPITVCQLLLKIKMFHDIYSRHEIPNLDSKFDLQLFNTYRSYLYPKRNLVSLTLHTDKRGCLFEAIKCRGEGHTFMSTTMPNITRGGHYHTRKVERFLVLKGVAEIKIRKLFCSANSFIVNGDNPQYIDMPTFHTHNITNIGGGELITLFWCNEIFDPQDADTFKETV